MKQQDLLELDDRLRKLKSEGLVDCAEILRGELTAFSSKEWKLSIYSMLGIELQSQRRFEEAESVIRERISLAPEMPDPWISLAVHFFNYAHDPKEALNAINVALERASTERNFFRQAHLERIRIALALKDYSTVEESLLELINYVPPSNSLDVQLETEFLARISKSTVSESLISAYREKVQSEARRGSIR